MYQSKFIFFTLFFGLSLISHASEDPNYCGFYEKSEYSTENTSQDVYYCFEGKEVTYSFSELATMMSDIENSTRKNLAKEFQHLLAKVAYTKVRDKGNEYLGLYDEFDYSIPKVLGKCDTKLLNSRSKVDKEKNNLNRKKQKDILVLHLINALKVNALFNKNKNYYSNYKKVGIEYNQNYNKCRIGKRKCENKKSFWEDRHDCASGYETCLADQAIVRDINRRELDDQMLPLYQMVQKTPLLFENKVEGGFFEGMLAENLSASKFQKSLIAAFPKNTINDFQKLFNSSHKEIDMNDFFSKNGQIINNIMDDPILYNSLIQQMKDENKEELARLDEAAEAICHASGKTLHHNKEIISLAMNDYLGKAKSKDDLKERMSFFQSSHCFLLKTEPQEGDGMSAAAIGGMVLLGIGGGLQIIPLLGSAAGTGLIIAGASLSAAGGVTLASIGFSEGLAQTEQLEQNIGLQSAGMSGYEELIQLRENRDSNLTGSAVSMVLLPLDLWGLNYIKNLKALGSKAVAARKRIPVEVSRRLNVEQRQVLEEIENTLGNTKGILLERYVGLGSEGLSKPDQIYLAAIADMVEKEIKNNKNLITPTERKFAAQHVIDDVIKKCEVKKSMKGKGP